MVDCITSILKTHSIASVIRFNKGIVNASSYKKVFEIILDYVKQCIRINTNDKFEFKKDILYGVNTKCKGKVLNGYDGDAKLESLISDSFAKIHRDASIYDAVQQMLKDCCTSLKTPAGFNEMYENIGDVLIPFYFKEEYADKHNFYNSMWFDKTNGNSLESVEIAQNDSKIKLRPVTMRDIFMPFYVAWGSDSLGVYENINPDSSKVDNTISINGFYQKEILSM